MKVKFLKKSSCQELLKFSTNSEIKKRYDFDKYPDEFLDYLGIHGKMEIDNELELSPKSDDDLDSSIKIFESLKGIDRVQANDKRLWVSLTHDRFYSYSKVRWKINSDSSDKAILRRLHFEGSSLEARMRNSISRLWWAAKVTYDKDRCDPYELTKVLWSKQQLQQSIVERSYGTYSSVVKGILEVYLDNTHLSDSDIKLLAKGLNGYGGVKLLSNLGTKDIKTLLFKVATYNNIVLNQPALTI